MRAPSSRMKRDCVETLRKHASCSLLEVHVADTDNEMSIHSKGICLRIAT